MIISQFVLEHVFNKVENANGTFYWRECILTPDMAHGDQGYIVVYPNGEHLHTYHYPPNFL